MISPRPSSIRILHVITSLGRGGAERQLVSLVSNTKRSGYEHVVCYLRAPDDFAEEIRQSGPTVIGLDVAEGKGQWFSAARKLIRVIKAERPDIVQTWLYDADISTRLARLGTKRFPIITSLQSPVYEPATIQAGNLSPVKVGGLRWLDQLSAKWSNAFFVACSQFVAQSAKKRLGIPASKIKVIYNSVDPNTLRCEPDEPQRLRQSLEIPEGGFVYISVGRLDPPKGHAHLLRAFQRVAASQPRAYLALVGDGPSASDLRELANELGIQSQVRFLGRRKDIGACLEMADVFVFPSLFEGLPLALVEAMFKKLPCIVSRIDMLLEVVTDEETGLLVAPGSVDELATAMTRLYAAPGRRKVLGLNGYQVAVERFNQQTTIPQWEALYDSFARKAAHDRKVTPAFHHLLM
jgi:glycosyltransferase involved in cell wall biosynthesis